MNLYVGNLPFKLTEEEFAATFEAFGQVESAKIIKDRYSNKSRGFGFVEMPNDEEGKAAIEGVKEIQGREVVINEARPKN